MVKKSTVNLNKLLRLDMAVALTLEELRGITLSYAVSGCVPCLSSARVYNSDLGALLYVLLTNMPSHYTTSNK